jgi:hypothetical protein
MYICIEPLDAGGRASAGLQSQAKSAAESACGKPARRPEIAMPRPGCNSACNFDPLMECTPWGGQVEDLRIG